MNKQSTSGKEQSQKVDVYQIVTDRIIEALGQGTVPWLKTWQGYGFARNYVSKHVYSGINALITSLSPHDIPYFVTKKQATDLGGMIIKGSRSLPIVYWKVVYKDKDGRYHPEEEGQKLPDAKKLFFARYYKVFNIMDVEGVTFDLPFSDKVFDPIPTCEQMVDLMPNPPLIEYGGDDAFYSPSKDLVKVPKRYRFDTIEDFYFTLFHELIHATGHSSRLNRPEVMEKNVFASLEYSKEELTAEIGASFLANIAGIETPTLLDSSHAYINGWLKKLKGDRKFIFVAAKEAKKGVGYVLSKS
ncbi:MAG: zincin-like metallopeptidase domain-containing protein [Bacteroidota bacterium]